MRYDDNYNELDMETKIRNLKEAVTMLNFRNISPMSQEYLKEYLDSVTCAVTILSEIVLEMKEEKK